MFCLCTGQFDLRVIQNYMISILQTFESSQNNIKSASKSKEDHGSKDSTTFSRMMNFTNRNKNNNINNINNNSKNEKNQSFDNDVTYLEDVNSYYNKAFASKLQASIVYEIIQVLTETFGISQVSECMMCDCFIFIDLSSVYLRLFFVSSSSSSSLTF